MLDVMHEPTYCTQKTAQYRCLSRNYRSDTTYVLKDRWYDSEKGVHYANLLNADAKDLLRALAPPGVFTLVCYSLKYRARVVEREVPQHVVHIPFLWYAGHLKSPLPIVAAAMQEKGAIVSGDFFTQIKDSLPYLVAERPISWWHPLVATVSFFTMLPIARKVLAALGGSGIGVPKNPKDPNAFHGEIPLIQISSTGILLMSTSGRKVQAALDLVMDMLAAAMTKIPENGIFQSQFLPAKVVEAPQTKPTTTKVKKGQKGKRGKKKGKSKGSAASAPATSQAKPSGPFLSIPGAVIENEEFAFHARNISFLPFDQQSIERDIVLDEMHAPFMEDPVLDDEDNCCTVCLKEHPAVAQKYA